MEFLNHLGEQGLVRGNFLGLLNLLIGRRIESPDGTLVSNGITWRELATLLKKVRWDPEAARELGIDLEALPPRDRERLWYCAISQAGVDSEKASQAGDVLAEVLRKAGYVVGPAPGGKIA